MLERLHPGASAENARVVLFDFDGTLSLIRAGWVDVMVPMMVEILAELKSGEREEDLYTLVEDYVARLTGEQTIYQMMELARQVELREGKPLDPLTYKKMYHDRLMERIEYRREGKAAGVPVTSIRAQCRRLCRRCRRDRRTDDRLRRDRRRLGLRVRLH